MNVDNVVVTKTALIEALGDKSVKYLANMKMWFRQMWSKEMFDMESRKLLTLEQMHLHNQFLLAILNKIDSLMPPSAVPLQGINNVKHQVSSSLSKKRKRLRLSDQLTFEPAEVMDYLPDEAPDVVNNSDPNNGGTPMQERYSVQELFLPDNGLVMGRLLVGAWELGLVNAEESAAEMIGQAVQMLLKNILTAILMKKKNFKTANCGSFVYDIGAPAKDICVRNTVTRQKIDDSPLELDKEITSMNLLRKTNEETVLLTDCEELYSFPRRRISLVDLYLTLQDRNIIPSHSIYSINLERISNMLE